jgi:hypothetical protein
VTGAVNVNSAFRSQYTLSYNVKDAVNNMAITRTRTVIIINNLPPVITLNGADSMTWEAAVPFVDPGARAWDVIEGDITSRIAVSGPLNVSAASTSVFTLTYNVVDSSGLNAITKTRQVQILDTTIPVITLLGNATYYQQAATPYVDPGATAYDTLNGNITPQIVVSNPVVTNVPAGTRFVVTYNVRDAAGNKVVQVNRTVIIVDTIWPIIYLLGSASMTWEGAMPWVDPRFIANDTLGMLSVVKLYF